MTRYFVYVIGEIFLVVIGILISLQVNNWNEEKKDRLESFLGDPEIEEVDGKTVFVRKFPEDLLLRKDFLLFLENTKTRGDMNLTYLKNYAEEMRRLSELLSKELNR